MAPTPASYVSRLFLFADAPRADIINTKGQKVDGAIVSRLDIKTLQSIGKIVGVGKTVGMTGDAMRVAVDCAAASFLRDRGGEWVNPEPRQSVTVPVSPAPVPVPVSVPTSATSTATVDIATDAATDALREALELIASASRPSVDVDTVRAIVADALANRPADKLEIVVNGTTAGTVDGIRHECFDEVAFCLANGMHVYLGGPAGTGKSHTALTAAASVGLTVRGIITGNPMLTESRVFGYMNAHGDYVDTSGLYDAYKNGGTFIVDEIDNASPNVTVMLNTLMASDRYTFPNGETVERHESFRIVATANTFGTGPTATFAGRFPLDPSTLDRFSRMMVDYDRRIDTATAEKYLATADAVRLLAAAWKMRENIDAHGLRGFVTPRGIGRAAQYLAAGFPVSRIIDTLMPAGMNDGQRRQILESVSL